MASSVSVPDSMSTRINEVLPVSEKPTGPDRFRDVLTQLFPGTRGPTPYPAPGRFVAMFEKP